MKKYELTGSHFEYGEEVVDGTAIVTARRRDEAIRKAEKMERFKKSDGFWVEVI